MSDCDPNVKPEETTGATPVDNAEAPDLAAQLAAMTEERDRLVSEKAELHDRLLRRQAEFENFRKRTERSRSEFFQFAGMETVHELLPILDDFERALKIETADSDYVKGIELIYQRFLEALKKLGLEPLEAAGAKFDFNLHHAVDRVPTEGVEEETVLEELQRGYNYKGRLLRPAMVRVAVKP
jgi:molecular chaperone GrpE